MSSKVDLKEYLKNCFHALNMDMEEDTYQKLSELGVESPSDIHFLEEADLSFMKPIHIRKFLGYVKNKTSDNASPQAEVASVKPQQSKKLIQPQSPLVGFDLSPVFIRMPDIVAEIEGGKRINPDVRRNFVREVVSEVRKVSTHCSKRDFEAIAQKIVRKYPNTFEDRIGDIRIGSGHDSLLKQLISRNENVNRSAQPVKNVTEKGKKHEETICKRKSVSERDAYGCVHWSPTLSTEDIEKQEKVRNELLDMHNSLDRDIEMVNEKMKYSYGLLRKMINDGESVEQLIAKWPFLTEVSVLLEHCEKLIGLNVLENIENAYKQKGPILMRYFKSKPEMNQFLGQLETERINENYQAVLQGIVLSVQMCVGEEMTSLMFSVDEMASNDEIQQVNRIPWPRLAMLGETYLAARDFALIVDGQVIVRTSSYLEAVALLFSVYYIFNIQYPDKAATTLEFIQRSFVGINPDQGQKSSKRRRTSLVNSKVLKLINEVADFQWIGQS